MQTAVVVEIDSVAEVAAPQVQALLESCDLGMQGQARCVLGPGAPGSRGAAHATVVWYESENPLASVEVRLRGKNGEKRKARELAFSQGDPPVERWRATGFAIAIVVGDIIAEEDQTSPPAVPASSAPRETASPASERTGPWWLDGRFSMARGIEGAPAALGGELGASRRLDARWLLSTAVGFSAQQNNHIDVLRPSACFGVGFLAPQLWNHLAFSLRVQPRIEYIDATGEDASGAAGHAGRWAFGFGQALDAAWMASDAFGVVGGVELRELTGPTAVEEHGLEVALVPAIDFAVQLGVQYAIP